MVVRERVKDVFALAPPPDETFGVQQTKLLRKRRELGVARVGELGDAALAGVEPVKKAQATRVAHRAEERRRPLERERAHLGKATTLDRRMRATVDVRGP